MSGVIDILCLRLRFRYPGLILAGRRLRLRLRLRARLGLSLVGSRIVLLAAAAVVVIVIVDNRSRWSMLFDGHTTTKDYTGVLCVRMGLIGRRDGRVGG